ncbi:MAG: ABC transporter ATP-binding protein [Bryobacterales bacterium]|nr:ABC transporter ATP-binding protein [Bryobacterales bacterium]
MGRLIVEGLSVTVGPGGPRLLDNVSFQVADGQRRALVGRSGSGKSLIAASVMRLLRPPVVASAGRVLLDGTDLLLLDREAVRGQRGQGVFLLFQSPGSALNPCVTVEVQVRRAAARRDAATANERADEALATVGLREAARHYPFELSGGMRQRVLIAMALVLEPRVLIADEPTTGLDPLTQAEVLAGIDAFLRRTGASLLFITHDLRAAGVLCQGAVVLDQGKVVAEGSWDALRGSGTAADALVDAARRVAE